MKGKKKTPSDCRSEDLFLDATTLRKRVWIDDVGDTPLLGKFLRRRKGVQTDKAWLVCQNQLVETPRLVLWPFAA